MLKIHHKELTKIVKEIRDSNAKYILYEDNVANKVTETIRKRNRCEAFKILQHGVFK